jgi:hypothetical protein
MYSFVSWISLPQNKQILMLSIYSDHFSPSTMTHKEVDLLLELSSKNQFRNLEMLELLQGLLTALLVGCPAGANSCFIRKSKFWSLQIFADRLAELLEQSRMVREMADLLRQEDCTMSMLEVNQGVKTSSKDPLSIWSFNPQYNDLPINVTASAQTLQVLHEFKTTVRLEILKRSKADFKPCSFFLDSYQ